MKNTAPTSQFVESFRQLASSAAKKLQTEALVSFLEMGLPNSRDENWKYTSLQTLNGQKFVRSDLKDRELPDKQLLLRFLAVKDSAANLVFVNGEFRPELSDISEKGLSFWSIGQALRSAESSFEKKLLNDHLASYAPIKAHAFVALNSALFGDGLLIHVPEGKKLSKPIQAIFVQCGNTAHVATSVRNLIVLEENAEAKLVENYVALSKVPYLVSAVSEVSCAQGSRFEHTKIQNEANSAYHFSNTHVLQKSHSQYHSNNFNFGGTLVRNEIYPVIDGENAETLLNGLIIIADSQHVDNHTALDHAKPSSFSRQLYKGIYADKASGVFSGTIIVQPDAQKTNAIQSNKSLLLSNSATIDSRPQLKIYADDVKCTHGATVGQLDENAQFYLRSRGISAADAKKMLIHAFASDIISHVATADLREYLEKFLSGRLASLI